MPNHIHGIIGIQESPGEFTPSDVVPPTFVAPSGGCIGAIVGNFKAAMTRILRRELFSDFKWQRGFHDHIIRSQKSLQALREYTVQNPLKWSLDKENPNNR